MLRIKELSADVRARIAAGQVIENPASVIKELVENALDAGAQTIDIMLEEGGTKRITVVDDGGGMYPDELPLAVAAHSTSKISSLDDLLSLGSFGFRGEALSSMATIAKIEIASRVASEKIGAQLIVLHGNLSSVSAIGMSVGTQISVTELFAQTPARRKFLKSDSTELKKNLGVLLPTFVSNAAIRFSVTHNTKNLFDLPAQKPAERIQSVLQIRQQLLFELAHSSDHYSISGYLGAPQLAHKGKHRQLLFVNGRPVQRPDLAAAIKEVYGTLLEPRTYPVFVLHLAIPSQMVDVNITPKKDTVSFINEKAVRVLVQDAVRGVLEREDLHYASHGTGVDSVLRDNTMEEITAQVLRADVDPWTVKDFSLKENAEILQVHNLYLIAQTSHGIVIIDQHAAHERILYQQFLEAFEAKKSQESQKFSKPIKVVLSKTEHMTLEEHHAVLAKMGFVLTFADTLITVKAAPKVFHGRNFEVLLQEFAADLLEDRPISELDSTTHRTLAFLACRTAIKAGEALSQDERRRLLEKLFSTKTQFTCPHGRPVYIDFEMQDLHRLFKRIL